MNQPQELWTRTSVPSVRNSDNSARSEVATTAFSNKDAIIETLASLKPQTPAPESRIYSTNLPDLSGVSLQDRPARYVCVSFALRYLLTELLRQ